MPKETRKTIKSLTDEELLRRGKVARSKIGYTKGGVNEKAEKLDSLYYEELKRRRTKK